MRKAIVAAAAFAVLATSGLSCGDDVQEGQKTWVDRPADDTAKKKKPVVSEEEEVGPKVSPRWEMIAGHFEHYTKRPVGNQKNLFMSHLDKYVDKIELKSLESEDDAEVVAEPEPPKDDVHPLRKYPADEYTVIMIMTGTAAPKAVIVDPKARTHVINLDMEVGNEGGVVEAITQYELVIRQPNEPKPVRLNIRPEVFAVGERQAEDNEEIEQ